MKKANSDQIEKLIINYFDYIALLHNKIRVLNKKIRGEQEILSKYNLEEKEYFDMLVSDCTGKGDYRNALLKPEEIRIKLENTDILTEEECIELKKEYDDALSKAVELEKRFNSLQYSESERSRQIKKSRKKIKKYQNDLNRYKKEYKYNMIKIKKLDSRINGLTNQQDKPLVYKKED